MGPDQRSSFWSRALSETFRAQVRAPANSDQEQEHPSPKGAVVDSSDSRLYYTPKQVGHL
jgi:hypothetical protein